MGERRELSYCELRAKEIINTVDGRRLGRLTDIIFSCGGGEVKGIVVPYSRRAFFSRSQEIFIPWKCINKIGEDVVLVALVEGVFKKESGGRERFDDAYINAFEGGQNAETHGVNPEKTAGDESVRAERRKRPAADPVSDRPNCDRKCEKCMLFDCAYRWKE